jgi:hypothetical protein
MPEAPNAALTSPLDGLARSAPIVCAKRPAHKGKLAFRHVPLRGGGGARILGR